MKDIREVILWNKYQFFERGISPEEFKKTQMRDMRDVMEISNAVKERQIREEKVREIMMRTK